MAGQLKSQYGDANNCIRMMTAGISGSWIPPTLDASANLVSADTDGFTLNWTIGTAASREVIFISFAEAPTVHIKGAAIKGCMIL